MPKRPKFFPVKQSGQWMVSVPPSMTGTGKRERKFFEKKSDADKAAGALRTRYHEGERSGVISRALATDAAAAAAILRPHGLSLADAAREVVKRIESAGSKETFRERYDRVLPIGETHWSSRYSADMGKLARWLPADFFAMRCAAINPEVIRRSLIDGGAMALSTQENRARYVSAILNYMPRHRKKSEIVIMSADQIVAMFEECQDDAERWACGLMIYAGIRPSAGESEISRLDWEAVSEGGIFISREVSKTNSERIIPMTPALARAIKGHPKEGTVIPAGWKKKYPRLRAAAGIQAEQDITRHTFASHFLAAYGEKAAKDAMGHSANSRTLFRHYRKAIQEEEGKAFFE